MPIDPDSLKASLIVSVLLFIPIWMIFKRAGLKKWGALCCFVPFVGIVLCLGILAHSPWPNMTPLKMSKGKKS